MSSVYILKYGLFVFLLPLGAPFVWNCVSLNGLLDYTGQITCSIGGIPVPSITWTSPNGSILVSQTRYSISSDEFSATLIISSIVPEDAGIYTINASNVGALSTFYVTLSVYCKCVIHISMKYYWMDHIKDNLFFRKYGTVNEGK